MDLPRLSRRTVLRLPSDQRPAYDPGTLDIGIVHLGLGAFHRAHQAVYTEDVLGMSPGRWGICGVTQRSRTVLDQLAPQDGLYTVVERGEGAAPARVVGVLREVLSAREHWPALRGRLADPRVPVVTLTVTEKGYRHVPSTGRLDTGDPDVRLDLAGHAPRTVVGQLVRGLQARRAAGAGPVTLVSCDNLPANGRLLQAVVTDFVRALPRGQGEPLADWIGTSVRFPATVVDRIVPATTAADVAEIGQTLGVEDRGAVVTEPFRTWVIEDDFAGARPAWEAAGAVLTRDVAGYETVKLRMLNGSHSALAYLGLLAGHETIADAIADPLLRAAVDRLLREEVEPTLRPPAGVDLDRYRGRLLVRYANRALRHRTAQIATDGSQKLPQRLLGTVRDRLVADRPVRWLALAVAAWMLVVWRRTSDAGQPIEVSDPLADRIAALVHGVVRPVDAVDRLLSLSDVFGPDLAAEPRFRHALAERLGVLTERGVRGMLELTFSAGG